MRRAVEVLLAAPGDLPLVVFVGHRSRTMYEDHDTVHVVLEILRENRMFRPVHGGKPPFDMYLHEICDPLGIMDLMVGPGEPEEWSARFDPFERELDILDGACLVVAFHPENGDVDDADPRIVGFARELGIPVIGVSRRGRTTWT